MDHGGFHKWGIPTWFILENPIQMDDDWSYPVFHFRLGLSTSQTPSSKFALSPTKPMFFHWTPGCSRVSCYAEAGSVAGSFQGSFLWQPFATVATRPVVVRIKPTRLCPPVMLVGLWSPLTIDISTLYGAPPCTSPMFTDSIRFIEAALLWVLE